MKRQFLFRMLILFASSLFSIGTAAAQNISVKGVVTEPTGEPMVGATVVQVGSTSKVAVTDLDGSFTLTNVDPNGKLQFSFMGYKTLIVDIAGRTVVNVAMEYDSENLQELVVVGYGQMKRTDLTGSVVSVGADVVEKAVITSVDQILQGRAAGVQIQANSGAPGASSSVRIRGISSLNASNEPIYVIDGVIIDGSTGSASDNALSGINPADIVSMDVLKDASATAIYGSRAANGVIIITTKRGQTGGTSVTYDGYVGFQEMPKQLDMLSLREYAELKNIKSGTDYAGDNWGILMADDNFVRADLLGEGTNWQDELFSQAKMTSHNISVSGGNEKNQFSLGAGYLNQDGIAIGSGFKRYNLRGSYDAQVKKFLKMGVNFAFNNSYQKLTVQDESLIQVALKQTPNVAVRNPDGSFDGPDTDEYVQNNPVGLALLNTNNNEKMGIRGNTYAEITFVEGLKFKTDLSLDYGVTNTERFNPSYTFGAIVNETRTGSFSKSYNKYWAWRNILTYDKVFGDKHNVSIMLGEETQKSRWEYLMGSRAGYISNSATDLTLGGSQGVSNNGNSGESSLMSFFGRLFYSFDDRYLFTATLRRDGSSKFADGNRWGWFPSAAFAWKISSEEFMHDVKAINNLKLRLGYGGVGNQNVTNNAYLQTYASIYTNFNSGALLADNTPNKNLTWETTYSYNVGLDLNMFNNRIEFIADVYYKKTNDLLLQVPLPYYVGTAGQGSASSPWKNIGSLSNKGLELTLNTINVDNSGFQWRSNFVFSLNRNRVESLDTESSLLDIVYQDGSEQTIVTRTAVGQPIGQFYGYKVIGRFEKATDFYYKDAAGTVQPVPLPEGMEIAKNSVWIGDYIFEDINKDGVINEQDRTYIGNPEPDFTFGIGNSFYFKGFDLNIMLTGSYGNDVVNWGSRFLTNPRQSTNLLTSALDYAKLGLINEGKPDDYRNVQIIGGDAYACRMASSNTANESNYRFSDKFVEDGSYLRIQSLSFGYTFPYKWMQKIYIQNLRLYCNIQNLYTFTKYKGYDPEVGSYNQNVLMTGFDAYRYPSPRIFTFGINVTF